MSHGSSQQTRAPPRSTAALSTLSLTSDIDKPATSGSVTPEMHEEKSSITSDDFESLNLGSDDDPKLVRIGKALSTSEKQAFTSFLKDRVQSFAFSYEDMPGLDSNLVEHKLPIKPGAQPVKARHFS
ncbi:hypothetical protein Q3G72_009862 [Acer saccharum]|nr:hypothetical protein Q3G72_009862 [Acer saccharum]